MHLVRRNVQDVRLEVRAFLDGSDPVDFRLADRDDAYAFVRRTLVRFRDAELDKPAKGLLRRFLGKVTGLSRAQLTRLIGQYRATGRIEDRRRGPARSFEWRYTAADMRQLAEADEILGDLCGAATRRVMQRQFEIFGDPRHERLAGLSNGHSTGCAGARPTVAGGPRWPRRGRCGSPSASAASRIPAAGRASCGSTPSTRATSTARRASK